MRRASGATKDSAAKRGVRRVAEGVDLVEGRVDIEPGRHEPFEEALAGFGGHPALRPHLTHPIKPLKTCPHIHKNPGHQSA